MATFTLPSSLRQPGLAQFEATAPTGSTHAELSLALAAAELTDPTVRFTITLEQSVDDGANWAFVAAATVRGQAGQTTTPMFFVDSDPTPNGLRVRASVNVTGRAAQVGATLTLV